MASSCLEWLLGYGDGWSGIEVALWKRYGDVLVRLQPPLRNYLIVETSPEGLRSIQGRGEIFVGPSLIAAKDRSVLAVGTSMANRLCRIHEPNHEERRCPRF